MKKNLVFLISILSVFILFATNISINAMDKPPTEILKINLTHLETSLTELKNKLKNLKDRLEQLNTKLKAGITQPTKLTLSESIELTPALTQLATEKHLTFVHFKSLKQYNSWICGYYAMYNAQFISKAIQEAIGQNKNILEYINEKLASNEYKDGFSKFQKQAAEEIYGAENIQQISEKIGDKQHPPFYAPKNSIDKGLVGGKAMLIVYMTEQPTATHPDEIIRDELKKSIDEQLTNISQDFKIGQAIITGIIYRNAYLGLLTEAEAGVALDAINIGSSKDKIFLDKLRIKFGTNKEDKALSAAGYFNNYLFKDVKKPTDAQIKQIIDILIEIKKESGMPTKQEKTVEEIVSTSRLGFNPNQVSTSNTKNLKDKILGIYQSKVPAYLTIIKPSSEHFVILTFINLGENKEKIIIIMDSFNTKNNDPTYKGHIIKPIKWLLKLLGLKH